MVVITTAHTKTVLHLDKGDKATIIYSDGAYTHKLNRCVWIARDDNSTWVKYCDQWNRVYQRGGRFVDGMYLNGVYDPDGFAE